MNEPPHYRAAASVLLLRDSPEERSLEVLMMQRPARMSFPGAWVFPGGCLEAQDHSASLCGSALNVSEADACAQLQVTQHAMAWWFAAVRELFEETGVLLASPLVDSTLLATARRELLQATTTFPELAERHRWCFDLAKLHYVSFWIAPEWVEPRYATRFFAARFPETQRVFTDSDEAVALQWFRPADAVHREAELRLPRPTVENLKLLVRFDSVDAAINALSRLNKPAIPAVWPQRDGDGIALREVNQNLEGLQIRLSQGVG